MKDDGDEIIRRIRPAHTDERGTISDIVENVAITHATIITSKARAVRGNHYHRDTYQYLYMLQGRMRLTTRSRGGSIAAASVVLEPGDLAITGPGEEHAMRALEDTTFLVLSRGPRGGSDFESDTFRLRPDELLERPDDPA